MPSHIAETANDHGTQAATAPQSAPGPNSIDFEIIELFFFAYRDFISDPDAILEKSDMGRAHHRVVHFVNREPGMTVATLLDTLKITKQSLARVLKQLLDDGYIRQEAGPEDRRQRKLYTTPKGQQLALALASPQALRIERAFASAGAGAREHIVAFLTGMRDQPSNKLSGKEPDHGA